MLARGASTASATSACIARFEALMRRGVLPTISKSSSRVRKESSSIHLDACWSEQGPSAGRLRRLSDTGLLRGESAGETVGLRGLVYFQLD